MPAEKFLRVPPCWFGNICEFIEVELGQKELRESHKLRGRPPPWGAPLELVTLSYVVWSPPKASRVSSGLEKINLKIFFPFELRLVLIF